MIYILVFLVYDICFELADVDITVKEYFLVFGFLVLIGSIIDFVKGLFKA